MATYGKSGSSSPRLGNMAIHGTDQGALGLVALGTARMRPCNMRSSFMAFWSFNPSYLVYLPRYLWNDCTGDCLNMSLSHLRIP